MTLDFVTQHLYCWKNFSFWNHLHKKLVKWNIELRIKDGGTGILTTSAIFGPVREIPTKFHQNLDEK